MYSQQHPPKDSSVAYLIKTNKGYFDHKKLNNREQEILMNTVIYYANLEKDGDGTAEAVESRFGAVAAATSGTFPMVLPACCYDRPGDADRVLYLEVRKMAARRPVCPSPRKFIFVRHPLCGAVAYLCSVFALAAKGKATSNK